MPGAAAPYRVTLQDFFQSDHYCVFIQ